MASFRLISELVRPSRRWAMFSRMLRARSTAVAGLESVGGMARDSRGPSERRCPKYRIYVQDIEQGLAPGLWSLLEKAGSHEHVFSLLNNPRRVGNYPSLVCNFLVVFH